MPIVNVSNSLRVPKVSVVSQNDIEVGQLAAKHLEVCGCQSFGFYGQRRASYSDQRWIGFRQSLAPHKPVSKLHTANAILRADDFKKLQTWLRDLPRPVGIFAALDSFALAVLRAARALNLNVPEDVAILGAGNDDFEVEFEQIPLSSICLPARRIGYEAGALIDRILSNKAKQTDVIQLPVGEIARRRSTDVQYSDDSLVAQAVQLIRDSPSIRVAEIARTVGVARTGLQRRFIASLGHGILNEIQRVRLHRAQMLLMTTDNKLEAIAEESGFSNAQRLRVCFRDEFGVPPGTYRKQFTSNAMTT